ncbi:hypothetical protein [Caldiplasma sukawensis]
MKSLSVFDGTEIGEFETIMPEISNIREKVPVKTYDILKKFENSLDTILRESSLMNMACSETGKTKHAVGKEIELARMIASRKMAPRDHIFLNRISCNRISFYFTDRSNPFISMAYALQESFQRNTIPVIIPDISNPLTIMWICNNMNPGENMIYPLYMVDKKEKIREEILQNYLQSDITFLGDSQNENEYDFNSVRRKTFGAGISVIGKKSYINQSVFDIFETSLNHFSNSGFRDSIFFIETGESKYFINRLSEEIRRRAEKFYGPDSNVNYFNGREQVEMDRETSRNMLKFNFDYVEDLPETVHIFKNEYGPSTMNDLKLRALNGPILTVIGYSSLIDVLNMVDNTIGISYLNILSDSFEHYDLFYNNLPARIKVGRNLSSIDRINFMVSSC